VAVALGNAPGTAAVRSALAGRRADASPLVREHIDWALARHSVAATDASVRTGPVDPAPVKEVR
jgi:epoxyqueuosine reductase